jgi:putative flippase GtrA
MLKIFNKGLLEEIKRIASFSVIGVLNSLITWAVDEVLNSLFSVGGNVSYSIGYFAGMVNSYIFNSIFTFNSKSDFKKSKGKMLKFLVINILSYLASLGAKNLGAIIFSTEDINWINSLYGIATAQVVNYLGYKLWVYRDKVKNKNF